MPFMDRSYITLLKDYRKISEIFWGRSSSNGGNSKNFEILEHKTPNIRRRRWRKFWSMVVFKKIDGYWQDCGIGRFFIDSDSKVSIPLLSIPILSIPIPLKIFKGSNTSNIVLLWVYFSKCGQILIRSQ